MSGSRPEPSVSVAVLTCNRLEKLKRCLETVLAQLTPKDEVVIYDTGSTDGTREWLEKQSGSVRPLFAQKSSDCDFASARNALAEQCRGDVVAFLDDDCYVTEGWLARLRRKMTEDMDAVGGLVLPSAESRLPQWWSTDIGWTAGMSARGVWCGHNDCYPATANMAVRREILRDFPFTASARSFGHANVYLAGREDAHWWLAARRAGLRLTIDPKLAVAHHVEQSRFTLDSVLRRAYVDGRAAWAREQNTAWAQNALNDFGRYLLCLPSALVSPVRHMPETVWAIRQLGLAHSAGLVKPGKLMCGIGRALKSRAKFAGGTAVAAAINIRRGTFRIPDKPNTVLVVAPSYLGDAMLLQAAVHQLSHNLPSARIEVLTPYPELFASCSANVMALHLDTLDETDVPGDLFERSDVIFVPYWHRKETTLWRKLFSAKGITFDSDVGFNRRLEYLLARKNIPKRFTRNEAFNLSILLHQWPARVGLRPPRLVPDTSLRKTLLSETAVLRHGRYAMLQVDTAQNMKAWPVERWARLAEVLIQHGLNVGIVAAEANSEAASMLVQRFGPERVTDLGGCSIRELIALISGARIAVGGCSGPKHLAFALGIPTFTVYGPMKPERWGPLNKFKIHGSIVSPVPYLTPQEAAGQPVNIHMLRVDAEAAAQALRRHLTLLNLNRELL